MCYSFSAISVQKMPQTVQTVGQSLFLGRTCQNEFWWVCVCVWVHILLNSLCSSSHCGKHRITVLWINSTDRLCCVFRVLPRASRQLRKIKRFQLPLFQSPHHRKPPQRRVKTQPQRLWNVFCLTWATIDLRDTNICGTVKQFNRNDLCDHHWETSLFIGQVAQFG